MQLGPKIWGVGVLCFLLVGPVGPCGPASILGAVFLFAAFPVAIVGWLVSVIVLLFAAARATRAELIRPAVAATMVVALLTLVGAFTLGDAYERWMDALVIACASWPPVIAACVVVARWRRERAPMSRGGART